MTLTAHEADHMMLLCIDCLYPRKATPGQWEAWRKGESITDWPPCELCRDCIKAAVGDDQ